MASPNPGNPTLSWSEQRGEIHEANTTETFFKHSSAKRINTVAQVAAALSKQYPTFECVITRAYNNCNLLGFAASGAASYDLIKDDLEYNGVHVPPSLSTTLYVPPARRTSNGVVVDTLSFAKLLYKWNDKEFLVYFADGDRGIYPEAGCFYILTPQKLEANLLVRAAGAWTNELHDEIWVFDGIYGWQKSKELYNSIRNASWDNVILDPEMKKTIVDDHMSFFNGQDTYAKLKVPWKRGIIYYGPPGNGMYPTGNWTLVVTAFANNCGHSRQDNQYQSDDASSLQSEGSNSDALRSHLDQCKIPNPIISVNCRDK